MILSIKNKLSDKYNIKTDEISLVKIRGGSAAKILFFAFSGRQKLPFLCAKTSSLERYNPLIKSESDSLISARNSLPDNLKTTIPKPLGLIDINSHLIALEEFISGRQANFQMNAADLRKVLDWLCHFHQENILERKMISKEFLNKTLSRYNLEDKVDNDILEIWGDRSVKMPVIKQHGDFHFVNVFFQKGELRVIDWTNYSKIIFPAYDLLFFLRRQRGGIEANKKMIIDYFDYFSIPKEVLNPWIKILGIVENLEKWSRRK